MLKKKRRQISLLFLCVFRVNILFLEEMDFSDGQYANIGIASN